MKPFSQWITNLLKRERPQGDRIYIGRSPAGVYVDEDKALAHAAIWASVRIIAETIAALPWRAHRRTAEGAEILDNTLDYLLHVEANPEQTAYSFRETALAHCLLWGNAYAEIERDNGGEPRNLWLHVPDKLTPDRTRDGTLWYVQDGAPVLPAANVFHLRGLGYDGLKGYSVITYAARSVGIGLALDTLAASTFANGAVPGGVITQKDGKALSAEAVQNLLKVWEDRFRGPNNGMKIGYLDAGMEFEALDMPLADAQFLESRKFQVAEIARWFRVPPHKLADLDRATFSNIEHQALEFVTDTLVPWVRRLETEAQVKLIGRNNRAGRVYTKINLAGLLRGDLASRYQAYATGRQWGWLSANDVRELEDINRIPGGDDYWAPVNMVPADMLREIAEPKPEPAPAPPPADQSDRNEMRDAVTSLAYTQTIMAGRPAPAPEIHVAAPVIEMAAPVINIDMPAMQMTLPEMQPVFQVAAPVVNMAPAEIRIDNIVQEREQPAPIVNVAAPVVNVAAPMVDVAAPVVNVAPAEVHIEAIMPAVSEVAITSLPGRETVTEVRRGLNGEIVESVQVETDLRA